ncbi:MAG TPA: phosphoglycerate mutase family protein [Candidatus Dormibacteraeota bacterium]|jgi:8-oxo-dGTP diphosphatase
MAAQLIHVVRHAHAGDRQAWSVDDDLRPLSERGCGQAERLADKFGGGIAAIYSSPSLRCLGTVLPLARAQRLAIVTLEELYEGGGAAAMLVRLGAEPGSPLVACTHGDIVADLLGLLIGSGLTLPSLRAEKGSTWTLEVTGGVVGSARYAPPP